MEITDYETKDGRKGKSYKLEAGDVVEAMFEAPKMDDSGEYTNYSLGVTSEEHGDIYIRLTKTQYEKLEKAGDIQGRKIKAYKYKNKFGEQVGVKVLPEE